jgi:hypothetical protein
MQLAAQPSLWDLVCIEAIPGVKTPGYSRKSLRDFKSVERRAFSNFRRLPKCLSQSSSLTVTR